MGIASSMNILANLIGAPAGGLAGSLIGFRPLFFITGGVLLSTVLLVRRFFIDVAPSPAADAAGAGAAVEDPV